MGHRALVAYRRPDRRYDLRYSHWGGEGLALATAITHDAPLARSAVDAELLAAGVALDHVLTDYLDPRGYEALYLVSPAFAVRPYRAFWLGWGDGRRRGRGALVAADPGDDLELRTWFRATKTALADVVEMGVLSRRAAQAYLEARVCEDRDGHLYTYDAPSDEGVGEP
ncbi:DUF6735 family protein [Salinilacihabitans rarus]|uniref:DUF6735 family protein n=1 Tax=Salinilacihabitans rarus TaxID=2961596 RepID=UPI0020C8BC65|nr:DUF6735 family protein [Salinilacihabitans rarus]